MKGSQAHLEASGAPVDELDGALGLDGGDGGVDILGHDVTTVQHAAGHVLAVTGVALHHLVGGLEAGVGDLSHRQLLVVGLLGGDDGSVSGQREVDAWGRAPSWSGTRVRSTLRAPSKRKEAVMEDTIWPIRRLRLV